MKYLEILKAILAIFPLIKQIVFAIEAEFPDAGFGKLKLAEVLTLIEGIWKDTVLTWVDIRPAIERLVALVVSLANATGRFKKAE